MLNFSQFKTLLQRMQQQAPLVHCITNDVVNNFTANVLLAIGASPAMVVAEEESAEFAKIAGALLINVGTVTRPVAKSMLVATEAAQQAGTPWVLDPVAYGALAFRTEVCQRLLRHQPTIIRGNASEIVAMSGQEVSSKGVDSTLESSAAFTAAQQLARQQQAVVAVTGAVDYITDGSQHYSLSHGHPQLTKITGAGCALSAMVAAYSAIADNSLQASLAALAHMSIAAELAAQQATAVGSFAVALIDQLQQLHQIDSFELRCQKI